MCILHLAPYTVNHAPYTINYTQPINLYSIHYAIDQTLYIKHYTLYAIDLILYIKHYK